MGRPRLVPGEIGELRTSPKKNSKELYEAGLRFEVRPGQANAHDVRLE